MKRLLSVLVVPLALLAGCTSPTTYRVSANGQSRLDPKCQVNARRASGEFCRKGDEQLDIGATGSALTGALFLGLATMAIVSVTTSDFGFDHEGH